MNSTAPLLLAVTISANVFADASGARSVSLLEPAKSAAINSAATRISPNQWKVPACLTCEDVAAMQAQLVRLGYAPGRVDGILGPRTRAAIKSYQIDKDLPVDGRSTDFLLEHLINTE